MLFFYRSARSVKRARTSSFAVALATVGCFLALGTFAGAVSSQTASAQGVAKSGKTAATQTQAATEVYVPSDVAAVLRIPSLNRLNDGASLFFKSTGGSEFQAFAALKLTPYGDAISALNLDAPVVVALFCDGLETPTPVAAVPVSDFNGLVAALGGDSSKPDAAGRFLLPEPINAVVARLGTDYALFAPADKPAYLTRFAPSGTDRRATAFVEPPAGLVEPLWSFEATPWGIAALSNPKRPFWAALERFATEKFARSTQIPVGENIAATRETLRANLADFRFDVAVDEYGTYLSFRATPKPNSEAAKRVADVPRSAPLDLTSDRFFELLPDVEAPISGQTDVLPFVAKTLPKPFDRLRRVEYSLNLPRVGELAAESWQFFLEVDDAEAFVKELTVPKAKEIGRYIGTKEAEKIGAEIFGNIAARRLERQRGRRRQPLNPVDPEEAARRGATLGALIGGAIGESSGEKEALKKYDVEGFAAYISDLETYVRQTAIMRADQEGKIPQKPLVFNGDRVLLSGVGSLISGLVDGDLETKTREAVLASANENARFADPTPLYARRTIYVVLDKTHLLVGLGNDALLRLAIQNWRAVADPKSGREYASVAPDVDFNRNLNALYEQTSESSDAALVSAHRIDYADAQTLLAWLRQNYFPNLPDVAPAVIPADTPNAFWETSVEDGAEFARGVVPNRTIENLCRTFADGKTPFDFAVKAIVPASKPANDDSDADSSDAELDFGFEDDADSDATPKPDSTSDSDSDVEFDAE